MKGRFSGIFEHWNQRNTEYYQEVFGKLEKENKTTFNIAAAFFNVTWLVFRKMYSWAILLSLISGGILFSTKMLCKNADAVFVIQASVSTIMILGLGIFGNTLYYKHVKSQVSKGYAEMPEYNPVDPIWSVLYSTLGSLLEMLSIPLFVLLSVSVEVINNSSSLFAILIIAIVWAIDYRKFHPQESAEPIAVTEESVNNYLKKSNLTRMIAALCALVFISLMYVATTSFLTVLGKKVLNQLDAMSAKKDIESRIDDEMKKKLNEIDELNKRILEKQKSGKVDESLEKDKEALAAKWAELAKYAKNKNSQKVLRKNSKSSKKSLGIEREKLVK